MAKLVPLKEQLEEVVEGENLVPPEPKKTVEPKVSKMDKCREIYNNNLSQSRKTVTALFISEANMTVNGASNYYQRFKKQSES